MTNYVKIDARVFEKHCANNCIIPLTDAHLVAKVYGDVAGGGGVNDIGYPVKHLYIRLLLSDCSSSSWLVSISSICLQPWQ